MILDVIFIAALTSESAKLLDTIQVTASKTQQRSEDVSTAVSVVTRDEIFQRKNTLLPDLLRGKAGVFIQQTTPGQGIPIIRGMKGSQNVHLVDGMRLNTAFFRNAPNQYLALIDSFMTEQIEVVRGPASVLYGGDALGGVVNILTHEPHFASTDWQSEHLLFASYDSADQKLISHYNTDFGNDRISSTLGVSYQDVGQRTIGGGENIPHTAYTSKAINNKWIYNPESNQQWMLDVQYLNQPATPRVDDLIAGFGQTEPDSELFLFKPNQRLFSHLRYRYQHTLKWADSSEFHIAWQKIQDDRVKRGLDSPTTTKEFNSSELYTLQGFWTKYFVGETTLVYGLDTHRDVIRSRKTKQDVDGTTEEEPRFPDNSKMSNLGIYADLSKPLTDKHHISIGTRYSHYTIDLNTSNPEIDDTLNMSDLTWHLGWLYKVDTSNRLYSNLGRGFRPPNIFDLGQVGDRPGNRFNIINPDLEPEVVHSLDFGWKHSGSGWVSQMGAFVSDYRNKITSVETGELTEDGQIIVQSENLSEVLVYGLESEFDYWSDDGTHWYAALNYTWGEEKDDKNLQPADRIPPLSGQLGLDQNLGSQWQLQVIFSYAARQSRLSDRDVSDPRINPEGTGGYGIIDLFANWNPSYDITIRTGLENILDKQYREHGSGLDGPGRSFHISVQVNF